MVPLHRVDRVRRQHRADLLEDVLAHLGPGQVEHQLVALEQRHPVAGREDPVGVLAEEVGVRVDHLGLEPEAELHAEPVDVLHQGSEALGPDGRVHPPVTESETVVAPAGEPAVVEHEPLDTDPGGPVGDRGQPVEVVVEVDGLPDVQHHRLVGGVGGQAALVGVPDGGQAVEAVVGGGDVHPGRRVALAVRQPDLARQEQLATTDRGAGRRVSLDPQHRVAAPPHVDGEHLAVGGGEAGRAEHGHRGRTEAGSPGAGLAQPEAVGDLAPLRVALALMAAGEVEHLDEVVRRGQHHLEGRERVAVLALVGQGVPQPQGAARHRLDLGDQTESGPVVERARCAAGSRPPRARCR